ncbi:MAG: MOSC N-terminal beta barrel domain-containing protein [Pseudomonadota bacterium]
MNSLSLSAIYRYPLKSARGHSLARADMDRFGLHGDRRWMLVDPSGRFVSQRDLPAMALLEVEPLSSGLRLVWDGESIDVEQPDSRGDCVISTVWEDTVVAPVADGNVNSWLSERLGATLRLVHFPETALRGVEPGYAPSSQLVAFSDGYPLLVISEAALDELNERLPSPVPMDRFRPNLVIRGAEAHAEDGWQHIRIGDAELHLVKPCSRCAIPSVNQQTGARDPDINRALAAYRRRDGIIYFGMNAIAAAGASFRVGDAVDVLT